MPGITIQYARPLCSVRVNFGRRPFVHEPPAGHRPVHAWVMEHAPARLAKHPNLLVRQPSLPRHLDLEGGGEHKGTEVTVAAAESTQPVQAPHAAQAHATSDGSVRCAPAVWVPRVTAGGFAVISDDWDAALTSARFVMQHCGITLEAAQALLAQHPSRPSSFAHSSGGTAVETHCIGSSVGVPSCVYERQQPRACRYFEAIVAAEGYGVVGWAHRRLFVGDWSRSRGVGDCSSSWGLWGGRRAVEGYDDAGLGSRNTMLAQRDASASPAELQALVYPPRRPWELPTRQPCVFSQPMSTPAAGPEDFGTDKAWHAGDVIGCSIAVSDGRGKDCPREVSMEFVLHRRAVQSADDGSGDTASAEHGMSASGTGDAAQPAAQDDGADPECWRITTELPTGWCLEAIVPAVSVGPNCVLWVVLPAV